MCTLLDPLGHFEVLNKTVVVISAKLLALTLCLHKLLAVFHRLELVAFGIDLLEQFKLGLVSRHYFVQLLVRVEFVLLGGVLFVGVALLLRASAIWLLSVVFLDELLQCFMTFLVRGFLVEHARLDDLVVEVLLADCAGEDALFND